MYPRSPMQYLANLDTGYNNGTGTPATGQQLSTELQAEHHEQQETYLGQQELSNQQRLMESSLTAVPVSFHGLSLDIHNSGVLGKVTSSENQLLVRTVYNLSRYDEQTFNLWHNLAHQGRPLEYVHEDAPGLAEVDPPTWVALVALGGGGRPSYATHLHSRHRWLASADHETGGLVQASQGRRKSIAETLSPISGTHSPSSPTSTGSRDQSPSHPTFLCPHVDCKHKPEGFTKWGYLANHVGNRHPSINNSGWEDRVQMRTAEELSPTRRRSGKQRKRSATPSTPDERAHKSTAMLSGIGTSMSTDGFSQSMLDGYLASSTLYGHHNGYCSAQSSSNIPNLTLDGDPRGIQFPESSLDFDAVPFPNVDNLQLPPSVRPLQRSDLPPTPRPNGTLVPRQPNDPFYRDTSSHDSGCTYFAELGRPPFFGDQPPSAQSGWHSSGQQVRPPSVPPDCRKTQ